MNLKLILPLCVLAGRLNFAQESKPAGEVLSSEPGNTSKATKTPYKTPPNRIIEFNLPLSTAAKLSVANSKNQFIEFARVAIAVPSSFDPEIATPILLVNGTSDGDASSIRIMPAFTNVALRLGWITIAADGPHGKPENDNPPFRWAMLSTLLDHINKNWPGSRNWPMVSAGVSGGGKWAGVTGAILSQKGYNLIGVFMGAVNQDMASQAAKLYDPAVRFKQVPIYLSSGTADKIATPQHHNEVKDSLLSNGFSNVRLESFKGGHALSEAELRTALNWFMEQYVKAG